ncbi:MAG TPA: YlbF family regulator [Erysipelotrichaceae bacterium]|nr:YlbF family regulator [Erysipelotrichaceae bacterium]
MDKIILKAKELKAAIDQTSEMKEYLKNKECLENSQEVIELKHHIANLKAQGKLTEAHNLEEIYHAHPLVNNYELSREALCQLLKTIETIIK